MRLADKIGARCYPLQMPVVTGSASLREMLQKQPAFATIQDLAHGARAIYVGLSDIAWGGPLQGDGFVEEAEMGYLIENGAVGEIAAWPFDAEGRILSNGFTDRLPGIRVDDLSRVVPVVAVSYGARKVPAIRAALKGGLISGLVTDERTAVQVLAEG